MQYEFKTMKTYFLIIFVLLCGLHHAVLTTRHHQNHVHHSEVGLKHDATWKRHYNAKKHNVKDQEETSNNENKDDKPTEKNDENERDINITKIYDHVSRKNIVGKKPEHPSTKLRHHRHHQSRTENAVKRSSYVSSQPGVWQFDTMAGDNMKLIVSDFSKKAADIVSGVRRSDYPDGGPGPSPGGGDMPDARSSPPPGDMPEPRSNELFMPGDEKTFEEPAPFLHRHDHGPFHHYENNGHPMIGGMARGAAVVTHQIELQSQPSNVYMHGVEKTQRKSDLLLFVFGFEIIHDETAMHNGTILYQVEGPITH